MSKIEHPLKRHLAETGETLTSFADRNGISRMHIYRVMKGVNTSVDRLRRLSEATGGAVTISDFIENYEVAQ